MRRIARQRLESALTELSELIEGQQHGDGFCFALDVPSFSIAEFLMPYLGTDKVMGQFHLAIPEKVRLVMDADIHWPCLASFEEPIAVEWKGMRAFRAYIYGFTEHADRYELNIRFQGVVKFPVTISKPGR